MGAPKLAPGRTEKRCPDCDTVKPLDEFYWNKSAADGHHGYCKPCWNARMKTYDTGTAGRGYHRNSHLKNNYGITLVEYNAMVARGNGRCWGCGELEKARHPDSGTLFSLAVDHNHTTKVVRGLLCSTCNPTIKSVDDDAARLRSLLEYLTTGVPFSAR